MCLLLARPISFSVYYRSITSSLTRYGVGLGKLQGENFSSYRSHQNNVLFDNQRTITTSGVVFRDASLIDKVKKELNLSVFKSVDLKELKSAPFPAILYGFGGVIPFVFPPIYYLLGSYSPFLATSQLMYGATILAFIGGVKWGNALAKQEISHEQIGKSTIPSLVAWSSLLVPEPVGFLILSSGLLGALYLDLISSKYPPWFCAIRYSLTGVAVSSLMVSFFCNLVN